MHHGHVPLNRLQKGPLRHRELPGHLVRRITAFKEILAEVDNMSLEEVLDDFRRDAHPEKEVAVWERLASTYQLFLQHNPTDDIAVKHEVFSILLMTSLGVKTLRDIKHLTPDQIKHLVRNYEGL